MQPWQILFSCWYSEVTASPLIQLDSINCTSITGSVGSSFWVHSDHIRRMHKNCRQFAQHLKLIGNLLEQLKITELKRQSLIHLKERLEYIEMDQREYTLEPEDMKVQEVIMKPEPSKDDTIILTKESFLFLPRVPINEAIQKENEKLNLELQHSQANLDVGQCEFIQHLLDVTEVVATTSLSLKSSPAKPLKKLDQSYSNADNEKEYYDNYAKSDEKRTTSRNSLSVTSRHDLLSSKGSHQYEEWHSDLLGCCSEPLLCIKTFFFPCGTFSRVASVAADRHI
ncbi:hypothetical protein HAX54_022477, partial [Datura stramonium]|nr:hypothetical protein [Datura stramonium]